MKVDFKNIATEQRNENTFNIDTLNAYEIVKTINEEDHRVARGIAKELSSISNCVEYAGKTLSNGGRIVYIGAGTSGRLGVLDAVECPPTYGVDANTVIGLIAGGDAAFMKAQEGAEDSEQLAVEDLTKIQLSANDYLIGIAASGRTPYVIGGLQYAQSIGCRTASIAITYNSEIAQYADDPIEVEVGPEVITGSTRMKAGSAQKMILNTISTGAMILNGYVYQNLMVDVQQTNLKLVERAKNIVMQATDCTYEKAEEALKQAQGHAKTAIVMILTNVSATEAQEKLKAAKGFVSQTL